MGQGSDDRESFRLGQGGEFFLGAGRDHAAVATQPAGVTNITYGAEWSPTLLPGSWAEVPDSGTGSEHIFSVPVAGGQLFMRLKVTGR